MRNFEKVAVPQNHNYLVVFQFLRWLQSIRDAGSTDLAQLIVLQARECLTAQIL